MCSSVPIVLDRRCTVSAGVMIPSRSATSAAHVAPAYSRSCWVESAAARGGTTSIAAPTTTLARPATPGRTAITDLSRIAVTSAGTLQRALRATTQPGRGRNPDVGPDVSRMFREAGKSGRGPAGGQRGTSGKGRTYAQVQTSRDRRVGRRAQLGDRQRRGGRDAVERRGRTCADPA